MLVSRDISATLRAFFVLRGIALLGLGYTTVARSKRVWPTNSHANTILEIYGCPDYIVRV
jgi:hypothetical protein